MSRLVSPALVLAVMLGACSEPESDPTAAALSRTGAAVTPTPLVEIPGGAPLRFWPFVQAGLTGIGEDPINLVFQGAADPTNIRAALMALDGNRSAYGFPPVAPFDCTWTDAIGGVMASYADGPGWTGGAIQLACGPYGPIRFHLRLFDAGASVIGNAHFEVVIPGTADHQVLSWELAEQLVAVDLIRTGLLDPAAPLTQTGGINPAPFREIIAPIYNGLPAALRSLIGGPLGDVTAAVPIATDGRATVAHFTHRYRGPVRGSHEELTLTYGQVIPKPFCAAPGDLIYVTGPVSLSHEVRLEDGQVRMSFSAKGQLQVTPVDQTGTPTGPTVSAEVGEQQWGYATAREHQIGTWQRQVLLPVTAPGNGSHRITLVVGTEGHDRFEVQDRCAP